MASLISRPSKTGPVYYVQYWQGPKQKRFRASDSFQIAKQKLRDFENAQARGDDSPLPTATPIADVLTGYVEHLRQATTPKSCQTNIYYLRDLFGPVCEALKVTSRKISAKAKKRPPKPGQDRRRKAPVIEAECFEQISTAKISAFIAGRMASRGLFLWNSEVGRRSIGIQTFWFQAVCANHIVWDAVEVVDFSRKHTANVRDSLTEIRRHIERLVDRRDDRRDGFAKVMAKAFKTSLGDKADEVAKVLAKHGIPRDLGKQALELAEQTGRFTVFTLVDALTRIAGRYEYVGDRTEIDQKASGLLALAA